jgi:hypothetical protein
MLYVPTVFTCVCTVKIVVSIIKTPFFSSLLCNGIQNELFNFQNAISAIIVHILKFTSNRPIPHRIIICVSFRTVSWRASKSSAWWILTTDGFHLVYQIPIRLIVVVLSKVMPVVSKRPLYMRYITLDKSRSSLWTFIKQATTASGGDLLLIRSHRGVDDLPDATDPVWSNMKCYINRNHVIKKYLRSM